MPGSLFSKLKKNKVSISIYTCMMCFFPFILATIFGWYKLNSS